MLMDVKRTIKLRSICIYLPCASSTCIHFMDCVQWKLPEGMHICNLNVAPDPANEWGYMHCQLSQFARQLSTKSEVDEPNKSLCFDPFESWKQ